ncbi:thermonuclease family protein [Thalassotalea crassostreae]|uniref:thermonuclease family protein n=1 Tax=Thalassotalea crassostreae TaxID=1763536 RepID=UPI0012FDA38C|nr:thermonuclease family protein [Thalassotalea crassostreae]
MLIKQQDLTTVPEFNVIEVIDGDTLLISAKPKDRIVELAYIDAPELDQPFGLDAKNWLLEQIEDNDSKVELRFVQKSDKALVLAKSVNLNRSLVVLGYVWLDVDKKTTDVKYAQDFKRVQKAKKGLWSLPDYKRIPPWIWREDSLQ